MQLFMDCSAGVSGDMVLAAFVGLGVDLAPLEDMFRAAGVDCRIRAKAHRRGGLMGHQVDVAWSTSQPLRTLDAIEAVLDGLSCPSSVQERARAAFHRLAQAEASVHGVPVDEVHFHEVGAVDTLVDVVGAFWASERLGVTGVVCSPLPWFSGRVQCEHGDLPLPAPAVVRLLHGCPVFPTPAREELVTPTGALLATALADRFDDGPRGVVRGCGIGYGSRPEGGGLRILLYDAPAECACHAPAQPGGTETVIQFETHLDHLTGEELGHCFDALPQAGALDVLWLPGVMKKNRPGGVLRVLCAPEGREEVEAALFRHTHTLGVRRLALERVVAPRGAADVRVANEEVRAKTYEVDGKRFSRPEYEALNDLARRTGRSLPELRMMLWGEEGT